MSNAAPKSLEDQIAVVGEPWAASSYYADAERWTFLFWRPHTAFRQMFDTLDLTAVVELACGHGRHSEQIAGRAGHIDMVDIFDANLEACRTRLGQHKTIAFVKGDGKSFRPLGDACATAVFCYDAMVHFSPDMVRSYLADTARILKPGGKALFHHSNYPAPMDRHYGQNPHSRNHMTAPLFAAYAQGAGLHILETRIIPWGEHSDLDALTLLRKPA